MQEQGFFATGTIRENRTAKCPLETNKRLAKSSRGTYVCAFDPVLETLVVKWNDNSVVTVISNTSTIMPLVQAKRYSRKESKDVAIPQPNVISDYNYFMGGVDLHDNGIANYRIRIRGKKWWWPLFVNMIDSTVVNSWKIYNIANDTSISQLEFRSMLAVVLMKYGGSNQTVITEPQQLNYGRPSKNSLPEQIRYDNIGHLIKRHPENARKKCRMCKNHSIYLCMKCKVHLHPDCFEGFHTK